MSKQKYPTYERGRSAQTGRFMPPDKARHRNDAVVERYKVGKDGPKN